MDGGWRGRKKNICKTVFKEFTEGVIYFKKILILGCILSSVNLNVM